MSIEYENEQLLNEFKHNNLISTKRLMEHLRREFPEYKKNSLYWKISDYVKKGYLIKVSRGFYQLPEKSSENAYCILFGDIKESRERFAIDENYGKKLKMKIKSDIDKISSSDYIFEIRYGDELNLVTEVDDQFIAKLILILYHLNPGKMRFILDFGSMWGDELNNIADINSYLLWNARDYMDQLDEDTNKKLVTTGFAWPISNTRINKYLSLILSLVDSWTTKQWETIRLRLLNYKIEEIAEKEDITFQAVSDRLKNANFEVIIDNLEEVKKMLLEGKK